MTIILKQGTLHHALLDAVQRATSIGALLPIPTEYRFIEDKGVRFFVRVLTSLARKDEERKKTQMSGVKVNPFLPYERDLFVADISETHVAVLNKFNVVENHLLLITREFEDQDTLLTLRDFEALWACLLEYHSLGFYNGGQAAGASQSHKHLQMVPLPLAPEGPEVPIEPLFRGVDFTGRLGSIPGLPFLHVFARPGIDKNKVTPTEAAEITLGLYSEMLRYLGMAVPSDEGLRMQSGPYCLLITRHWMLLVPRSSEFFEGISLNSLAFAGSLLVRNEDQAEVLKRCGPMTALKSVALSTV